MSTNITITRAKNDRTCDYYSHRGWAQASSKKVNPGLFYTSNRSAKYNSDYWILCKTSQSVQKIQINAITVNYQRTSNSGDSSAVPYIFALKADGLNAKPPCYGDDSYKVSISNGKASLIDDTGTKVSILGAAVGNTINNLKVGDPKSATFSNVVIGDGTTSFQYFWLNIKSSNLTIVNDTSSYRILGTGSTTVTNLSGVTVQYYKQDGTLETSAMATSSTPITLKNTAIVNPNQVWSNNWINMANSESYPKGTTVKVGTTNSFNASTQTIERTSGSVLKLTPEAKKETKKVKFVNSCPAYFDRDNKRTLEFNFEVKYSYQNVNGIDISDTKKLSDITELTDIPVGNQLTLQVINGVGNTYSSIGENVLCRSYDGKTILKTQPKGTENLNGKAFTYTPTIENDYLIDFQVSPNWYRVECYTDANATGTLIPDFTFTIYGNDTGKFYYDNGTITDSVRPNPTPEIVISKSLVYKGSSLVDEGPKPNVPILYPPNPQYQWQIFQAKGLEGKALEDEQGRLEPLFNGTSSNTFSRGNLFGSESSGASEANQDTDEYRIKIYREAESSLTNNKYTIFFSKRVIEDTFGKSLTGNQLASIKIYEEGQTSNLKPEGNQGYKLDSSSLYLYFALTSPPTRKKNLVIEWPSMAAKVLYNGEPLTAGQGGVFEFNSPARGYYTLAPSRNLTQFNNNTATTMYIPQSCTIYQISGDKYRFHAIKIDNSDYDYSFTPQRAETTTQGDETQ